MTLFAQIRKFLSRRDQLIFSALLCSATCVSLIETVSISLIMLFISMATNTTVIFKNFYLNYCYQVGNFASPTSFIGTFGFLLFLFYVLRALICMAHLYAINTFSYTRECSIGAQLFTVFLHMPYRNLINHHSSLLNHTLVHYARSLTHVLLELLVILSEVCTITCIYLLLLFMNWKITLTLTCIVLGKIAFITCNISRNIKTAGKRSQQYALQTDRLFSEILGNYKFIKLTLQDKHAQQRFMHASSHHAYANAYHAVWQDLTRFTLETLGFFTLISLIVYLIMSNNGTEQVLPTVSLYALAFYRLLPAINKIVPAYNTLMFNACALAPMLTFLEQPIEHLGNGPIIFNHTITLHNLSFSYNAQQKIFCNTSLTIRKHKHVGIVGPSGSGKSTLVDLITGLLQPDGGTILIDSIPLTRNNVQAWRRQIGYVPQEPFLYEGTVADNVRCGRPYNKEQIISALKQACMYDFMQEHNGLETPIAEDGNNLSGGQKQRLAIARALYTNPEILVLDEATSALDTTIEQAIMHEVYASSRSKTLIIITHRLATLAQCDRIYTIEDKNIRLPAPHTQASSQQPNS